MKYLTRVLVIFACCALSMQQNATRQGRNRENVVMTTLQQIQVQLNAIETESQRQSSKIQDVARTTTRLETQRQELMVFLDKTESRLIQNIDDVKGETRKITTLQDVIREDIDKIQQNQIMNKIWLEEQFRQIGINNAIPRHDQTIDSSSMLHLGNDVLTSLQSLQSALLSLRRMTDFIQSSINILQINMTDISNVTRSMMKYEKESLVTKAYIQSALQMFTDEKRDFSANWIFPFSNQESEDSKLPKDCYEIQQSGLNKTGIYRIKLKLAFKPIFVFCDMETEGGGWTVFQRRIDGSVNFLRDWQEYKYGFGNVGGEHWLGNENLYLLTHQDLYELRIDLSDFEDNHAFAKYGGFAVGSEREKYILKLLGNLTGGDAGDGLTYHASMAFSTIDVDNDQYPNGHCALDHSGGWWYNQCDASNLNGKYLRGLNPYEYQGVYWHEWQGPSYSLQSTKMMLRPVQRQHILPLTPNKIRNEENNPPGFEDNGEALSIDF